MQCTKNKDDTEIDEVGGIVWRLRDLQGLAPRGTIRGRSDPPEADGEAR